MPFIKSGLVSFLGEIHLSGDPQIWLALDDKHSQDTGRMVLINS